MSDNFISEMIHRLPSRIRYVLNPTLYHFQLAVDLDPSLIQFVPVHLQDLIQSRVDAQQLLVECAYTVFSDPDFV